MAYTMLPNKIAAKSYPADSLEGAVIRFVRESCEGLRFDIGKQETSPEQYTGTGIKPSQVPWNMEKDTDRLCLENALDRFLKSGKKEDAFDVYFCYLEMFVGDYEKTRRMIELLSEFEANGSSLLMKHRDHYSHSVYVFALGLAIYETNEIYQNTYRRYYGLADAHEAAYHYLQYWGLTALFHDIGYPFELPFEQVASYFEVNGGKRADQPFVSYQALDSFTVIGADLRQKLTALLGGAEPANTNELFAHLLAQKLTGSYSFTEAQMLRYLTDKPAHPEAFGHFMDHAYFSATILLKKMFEEMQCTLALPHLDALIAILMHNSLYKFCIAHYKDEGNQPFRAELQPLAYMLMLCDELQCWDRTAYGRNTKKELHPMGCIFSFRDNEIRATYLYDEREIGKINAFKDAYITYLHEQHNLGSKEPALKAYSGMFLQSNGVSAFQADIERIVDLTEIRLSTDTGLVENKHRGNQSYLSSSNFINLYHFAVVLNGRWDNEAWKKAKNAGREDSFLSDKDALHAFSDSFKKLSLEYKLSNINQAKAFAKYMNEIGCFYTDRAVDFELLEHFTDEDLLVIGVLEHQRWLQEHYDMGWVYGEPDKAERELLRRHKDMIPVFSCRQLYVSREDAKKNYERLDKAEQDKDTEPMDCMLAMLKMYDGLRIYRL